VTRFMLRQAVGRSNGSIQRCALVLCTFVLLLVTGWGNLPAFAHYEQRHAYQVSPLATPVTATTSAIITGSLNAPTSPLPSEATAEVTTGVTVAITSVTTTAISTVTTPITNAAPVVEAPPPTAELVNRGQISLFLVGAVLVGLLVLVVVVIGRQR